MTIHRQRVQRARPGSRRCRLLQRGAVAGRRSWSAALLVCCTLLIARPAAGQHTTLRATRSDADPAAVVLVQADTGGLSRVTVRLSPTPGTSEITSYQGEIRFDPERAGLRRVAFPGGVLGSWNQSSPGRIRFAAAAPTGASPDAMLVLYVTPCPTVRPSDFTVSLEELTVVEPSLD